jgi:hypothetical protein
MMDDIVCAIFYGHPDRRTMLCMRILTDRTALIQAVDRMDRHGGFCETIGSGRPSWQTKTTYGDS